MSHKTIRSESVTTPTATLMFPSLHQPKGTGSNGDGPKKFQCMLVFDKAAQKTPEFKKMVTEAKAVLKEAFDFDDLNDVERPCFKKRPPAGRKFDDAREKWDARGLKEDDIAMNLYNTKRPSLSDENVDEVPELEVKEKFYAGCKVRAHSNFYSWESPNKGVSFGLSLMQWVADGERLGVGRPEASDVFGKSTTASSLDDEDPLS